MVNIISFIKDYLVDQEAGIRQLISWFLNLVMEEEALLQAGAKRYERTDSRKASRNGYKPHILQTKHGEKHGELELLKPQFHEFSFETQVFEKYSRVEKSILTAVSESYLQGVSTRRVEKIMTALGVEGISASSVSRITKELDEKVYEFLSKPIEREIPYLFIDATYLKVRDGLHYKNKALFVVAGIKDDGLREILGVKKTELDSGRHCNKTEKTYKHSENLEDLKNTNPKRWKALHKLSRCTGFGYMDRETKEFIYTNNIYLEVIQGFSEYISRINTEHIEMVHSMDGNPYFFKYGPFTL